MRGVAPLVTAPKASCKMPVNNAIALKAERAHFALRGEWVQASGAQQVPQGDEMGYTWHTPIQRAVITVVDRSAGLRCFQLRPYRD